MQERSATLPLRSTENSPKNVKRVAHEVLKMLQNHAQSFGLRKTFGLILHFFEGKLTQIQPKPEFSCVFCSTARNPDYPKLSELLLIKQNILITKSVMGYFYLYLGTTPSAANSFHAV